MLLNPFTTNPVYQAEMIATGATKQALLKRGTPYARNSLCGTPQCIVPNVQERCEISSVALDLRTFPATHQGLLGIGFPLPFPVLAVVPFLSRLFSVFRSLWRESRAFCRQSAGNPTLSIKFPRTFAAWATTTRSAANIQETKATSHHSIQPERPPKQRQKTPLLASTHDTKSAAADYGDRGEGALRCSAMQCC